MSPVEMARHLSACGWVFDPDSFAWKKGEHALTVESIDGVLRFHPWVEVRLKHALSRGAVAFEVTMADGGERLSLAAQIRFEFPK